MKIIGIVLLVIGILNIPVAFLSGYNPIEGIMWTLIGGYLISRANKKQQDKEDRDKWMNGEA